MASRREAVQAALLIGKLHHQNPVFGYQPDKGDKPYLRIDVQRAKADIERDDSAENR